MLCVVCCMLCVVCCMLCYAVQFETPTCLLQVEEDGLTYYISKLLCVFVCILSM